MRTISPSIGPSPATLSGTSRSSAPGLEQRADALLLGQPAGEHDVASAAGTRGADRVDVIGLDLDALARQALRGKSLRRELAQHDVDVDERLVNVPRSQLRWSIQATAVEPASEPR